MRIRSRLLRSPVAALVALVLGISALTGGLSARCLLAQHCQACIDEAGALDAGGCDRVAPASPLGLDRVFAEYDADMAVPVVVAHAELPRIARVVGVASLTPLAGSYRGPPGGLTLRI